MSPTIRIDEDVFEALKNHAEPFVDTPNTVLRRILGLAVDGQLLAGVDEIDASGVPEAKPPEGRRPRGSRQRRRQSKTVRSTRAKTGTILAESNYEIPILEIIDERGGRAAAREVIDELGIRLAGQLTSVDLQELSSGDVRWRNRAQFVRLRLIEAGDLVKDSPRGVWEISEKGRQRLSGGRQ